MELDLVQAKRIEKETGLLCIDDCIATVAKYYDTDFEMMYIGGYCMQRIGESGSGIADRYSLRLNQRWDNLAHYHGVFVEEYSFFFMGNAIRKIRNEVDSKRPVMVLVNPYFCPWDDGYQRFDADPGHCFLVRGVGKRGLVCADPYFDKAGEVLPFSLFKKGIQAVFLFSYNKSDTAAYAPASILSDIGKMFEGLIQNGYFSALRYFCEDAGNCTNLFENIQKDSDLWIDPYIVMLMKINQSIQNMAVVTEYASEKSGSNELKSAAEHLWNLAVQWKQTRKLTAKLYFMRRSDEKLRKRIFERMNLVIDEMEELAYDVMGEKKTIMDKFAEKNKWKSIYEQKIENENEAKKNTIKKESCLSLAAYYNNRAFIRSDRIENEYEKADFSSIGTCYVMESAKSDTRWEHCGTNFELAAFGTDDMDNVACDGQRIVLPSGEYNHLALVGAAEFGSSSDILCLYDRKGHCFELNFQFTDYIYEPQYGECIIWKGRGIEIKNGGWQWMKETLYLYEKEYKIPGEEWTEILFPVNPSLHVFAVTLKNC